MNNTGNNPYDPDLTAEQEKLISKLTNDDLIRIDLMLLSDASINRRKAARLIATAMMRLKDDYIGIPDVFYARRIMKMVDDGYLEAFGNLRRMRFSEVKLTDKTYDFKISEKAQKEFEMRESHFFAESEIFFNNQQYNNSIEVLKKGLKLYPKSVKLNKTCAFVYFKIDDYEKAFRYLDKAISYDVSDSHLPYIKGGWKFELGLYKESIVEFSKIIDLNKAHFNDTIYHYRAMAYMYLSEYEKALHDYELIPKDGYDMGLYSRGKNDNYLSKDDLYDSINSLRKQK